MPQILRSKVSVFVELWQRGELLKERETDAARARARAARARVGGALRRAHRGHAAVRAGDAPSGEPWFCNAVWREYTGLDVAGDAPARLELVHPDERAGACAPTGTRRAASASRCSARCACARRATASIAGTSCTCCRSSTPPARSAAGSPPRPTSTTRSRRARRSSAPAAPRTSSWPPSRTSCATRSTPSSAGRACCAPASSTRRARRGRSRPSSATPAMQAALIEDMLDVSRIITGKLVLEVGAGRPRRTW